MPTTTRSAPAASASRTACSVRRPPPYCTGTSSSRVIRSQVVEVGGLALARAVEVHHVQEARAGLHERARRLERVVRVDGLVVEVALAQAHRLAVADVDRRAGGSCGAAGAASPQIAAKFPSSRSPCGPGLLGVELHAVDGVRAPRR